MKAKRLAPITALVASVGCGGTLYVVQQAKPPHPPADVFECVKSQISALGYNVASHDAKDRRITAKKNDYDTKMSDTQFRRISERLTVEVKEGADTGAARLHVEAHTFAEMMTQRGPTDMEQQASPSAHLAAKTILDACGS